VRALVLPYLGYAPFFIAEEEGFFRERGVDVEIVEAENGLRMLPVFVNGDLDVYSGQLYAGLLNAVARGAAVRIVADKGHVGSSGDTYLSFVARRDLVESGRLRGPADLRGRRISVSPGGTSEYYLHALLRAGGLSATDVQTEHVPLVTRWQALGSGALDLASAAEPWKTRIEKSGVGVRWMPAS
jgi:NitT/TauT family transport system substrate-binding protein